LTVLITLGVALAVLWLAAATVMGLTYHLNVPSSHLR
jgi:hypothetical protein